MQAKPKLLATPELVNAYWPQIEPLLASAPIAEDLHPHDIFERAVTGNLLIFVFEVEEGVAELAMVLAPNPSISQPGYTIVTIAGKDLKKYINQFWAEFQGWCTMNGARAIDAYVPERMEGLVEKLGFKRKSVHVRLSL